MPTPRWLHRLLLSPLVLLAALVLLFEEWGWRPLASAMAALGRLPVLRALEARIRRLSPWGAAVAFVVPAAVLLPFKLAALALIARGAVVPGVVVILLAKLTGTAIAARLYVLCEAQLLSLGWFAWARAKLLGFHERVHAWLSRQWLWQATHAVVQAVRRRLQTLKPGRFGRWWRRQRASRR